MNVDLEGPLGPAVIAELLVAYGHTLALQNRLEQVLQGQPMTPLAARNTLRWLDERSNQLAEQLDNLSGQADVIAERLNRR